VRLRARLALTLVLAALPLVGGVLWLRATLETRRFDEQMREFALATMEAGGRERCERDPSRFMVDTLSPPPPQPPQPPANPLGTPPPREPRRPGPPPWEDGPPERPNRPEEGPPPRPPPPERDPGMGARGRPPPLMLPPEQRGTRLWAFSSALVSANPRAPKLPAELASRLGAREAHAGDVWSEGPHEGRQVALRTPWPDGACAVLLVQRPWRRTPWTEDLLLWGLIGLAVGLLVVAIAAAGPLVRRIRRLGGDVARYAEAGYAEPLGPRGHDEGRDEIGELAAAFEDAGRDVRAHLISIEARERTLREFVANTTHDVAIPLTVLQGHLARLRRRFNAGDPLEPDVLKDALDEAHYIACLLQNLSAVARLEAHPEKLELNPVDLVALVERVLARHRPVAEGRGVSLVHAVPPVPMWAAGDVTLLEQAVSNLVHNGVRHGHQGGHVGVVLMTPLHPAQHFLLRVFDDGPGVPEDELPRLKQRRYRGRDARQREPGGAGLGLAIANDVCARHGFTLALRPAEVGGLEAEIAGPLLDIEVAAPKPADSAGDHEGRPYRCAVGPRAPRRRAPARSSRGSPGGPSGGRRPRWPRRRRSCGARRRPGP